MRSRRRAEAARRPRVTAAGGREPAATRNPALPSPEAVLEFLRDNPEAIGAREIARAFGLGTADQPALRAMLRAISRSGELVRGGDRRFAAGERLPEMMPVERAGSDADGFPLARPISWSGPDDPPLFRLVGGGAGDELPPGSRALARLIRRQSGEIDAEIVRRLDDRAGRIVGVFRRTRAGGEIIPADRRDKSEYRVLGHDAVGLADNELVVAEELPSRRL